MEFPAVSHTRDDFWQERHYTRSGMWWFTLFFGFFGLHHLLLKSPQTAVMVFLGNMMFIGYPWLYDLIQLSSYGVDDEELNVFGLSHPFGSLGLAKGMWATECQFPSVSPYKDNTLSGIPWAFFLYCLVCPIGIIASIVVGDFGNAIARILNFFPLGYLGVGYIFEMICMFCDVFIMLFKPAELVFGIKRPLMYRTSIIDYLIYPGLAMDKDGHSHRIMPMYLANNIAAFDQNSGDKEDMTPPQVSYGEGAPQMGGGGAKAEGGQEGGAKDKGEDKTPLDYFALTTMVAVIAGGLVLAAGRTANGFFPDSDDTPPNPGRV
jgi:TM2 domain-containing membrane protein YozV